MKKNGLFVGLFICFVSFFDIALAQNFDPIDNFFINIGNAITGGVGRSLALIAIAGVGVMFLSGRMNWMLALSVAVGVVIIFGAGMILSGF